MKTIVFTITSIIVLLGALTGLYLYESRRAATRFTEWLNELQQQGPQVVIAHDGMDQRELEEDLAAIQAIYQIHNAAWCEGDGTKYASAFTKDADFISFDGVHTIGREEIAESHQELFDRFLQNTCLQGYIERIKFLDKNIAIAYVQSGTRFDGREIVQRPSTQTLVAVKQDGTWLFSSFHNGRIDPVVDRNFLRKAWLGIQTAVFRR